MSIEPKKTPEPINATSDSALQDRGMNSYASESTIGNSQPAQNSPTKCIAQYMYQSGDIALQNVAIIKPGPDARSTICRPYLSDSTPPNTVPMQ